jgi:hypothetical protein
MISSPFRKCTFALFLLLSSGIYLYVVVVQDDLLLINIAGVGVTEKDSSL